MGKPMAHALDRRGFIQIVATGAALTAARALSVI